MQRNELVKREQDFYDSHWETSAAQLNSRELRRIEETVAALPTDCVRVLEVGCGDGRVSRTIAERRKSFVVGMDVSMIGLRDLNFPRCCGSADRLPFPDRSFDVVVATEILEHLPEALYSRVLAEMARVAAKRILITVPNRENLDEASVQCPACGSRFHKWGHQRSYTAETLSSLFPGFRPVRVSSLGELQTRYNTVLLWMRQRIAHTWFFDEDSVCYACQARLQPAARPPLLARLCDALNSRIWGRFFKRPAWLLGLYARV